MKLRQTARVGARQMWIRWVALVLLVLAPAVSRAQQPTAPVLDPATVESMRSGGVRLNFEDVDIKVLARIISQLTGRNIVLDQKVQGKITLASSRTVSPQEAWEMFVSALEAYGFGIEREGAHWRVSPITSVRQRTMAIYPGTSSSRALVAVIKVQNVPADQMVNFLRPLLSPTGVISGFPNSNTVVVADDAPIVRRVVALAQRLDAASNKPVFRIYYPQRVRAQDVIKNIEALIPDRNALKITVHQPTNGLLVVATPENHAIIEKMLASLERRDQAAAEAQEFFVFYLAHAQAEDLAKIMAEMLAERSRVEREAQQAGVPLAQPTPAVAPPMTPSGQPILPSGGQAMPGGIAQAPTEPTRANPEPFRTTSETFPTTSSFPISPSQVANPRAGFASSKVSADVATNALILYLTRSEYETARKLVEQLDIPRRQVLISAVIAEVSLRHLKEAGINWQVLTKSGVVAGFGGGLSLQSILQQLADQGFVVGSIDPNRTDVTINGTTLSFPNSYALLRFLNDDRDFNLVASPRLLTFDHKEANISVGQVVPFATGVKFDINGQPIINFDYREVGLNLKITPHISQGQQVRLEVSQNLQEVLEFITQGSGSGQVQVPVVSKREVNTEVALLDGQTLIIGGLVSKKTIKTMRKVPILGDIPGLGELLFRDKSETTEKTTLFIFLTPHVVDSPQKMKDITEQYNRVIETNLKVEKDAVERQDYRPEKRRPEPINDPTRTPVPGPAPVPAGQPAIPAGPPQQTPAPVEPQPVPAEPQRPRPPTRPDASWE